MLTVANTFDSSSYSDLNVIMSNEAQFNYRHMLKQEFENRKSKNQSYSLRAFALHLNVSASFLSQVLTGKKCLSYDRAHRVLKNFKWSYKKSQLFLNLVQMEGSKDQDAIERIAKQARALSEIDFVDVNADQFQLISKWYHFALMELTQLQDFSEDPLWISEKLGITVDEAQEVIDRLLRIGLLKRENNQLKKPQTYGVGSVPSEAIQQFHSEHLIKASEALKNQNFTERDFTGQTIALNKSKIQEVKELIWEFQNKMSQYYSNEKDCNSVYHVAIQLYRLDHEHKTSPLIDKSN